MMKVFELTGLGVMTFFSKIEIKESQDEFFICQYKYARKILKKFHVEVCNSINTHVNQKNKLNMEE